MSLADVDSEPLVSVLITNYNYGRFVGQAIESVLRQGYRRFEIVVCDDGSTDDSCEVVNGYIQQDERVRLIQKPNGGQASAFNRAYGSSRGQILCFLDADDVFVQRKLAVVVAAFQRQPAGLLVHQMMIVDQDGAPLQRIPTFTRFETGWIGEKVVRRGGRWRWMPTSGMALHREVAEIIFPVPEEPFRIDADMFILGLAPLLADIVSVEEILGLYRLHGANAYSQRGVDRSSVARTIRSISTAIDQINLKLADIGLEDVRFDPDLNLKLQEQLFLSNLIGGDVPRSELVRQYAPLMRSMVTDDLYSALQKVSALVLYAVLIGSPADARAGWASAGLGISHMKETIRRLQAIAGRGRS